jgi:hypothetical protein
MKIYTHWKQRECSSDEYRKHFFPTKAAETEAAKKAEQLEGLKVLARHDWDIAPTGKGIAEFCQDQVTVCGLEGEIA